MSDSDERAPTDPGLRREIAGASPWLWRALGQTIKVERVARGWERKELAGRSGLSYPYVSEIETGKKRPSWEALTALAEALGVRPSDLLQAAEQVARAGPAPAARVPENDEGASRWFGPAAAVPGKPPALAQMRGRVPSRDDAHRRELLRELLAHLETLPTADLERLLGLARALSE